MQTRIQGTTMPVLDVQLEPNESVFSESGELSWMTASIQMTTHTQMGGGGGLFGVLKRVAGGGSLFMTEYRAYGAPGVVSFATKVPGHIVPVEVGPGAEYMVHRHGFLCATPQVTIGVGFQQSLGAGIFGGNGFLLQQVGGQGTAWLELSRRTGREEPGAGRGAARASGPRGRLSVVGGLPDHHGSGHQEHDLRRRWNLSGRAEGPGNGVAADAAHLAAGAPDRRVPAAHREPAGGTGRRRRAAGRDRRVYSKWKRVSRAGQFTLRFAGVSRMIEPSGSPRNLRRDIVFAFALGLACYLAWLIRDVLVMLYVSALFAVVLTPMVRFTSRLHIRRWQPFKGSAVFFLLLVAAGALTAFGFLALPPVISDMQGFALEMPSRLPVLLEKLKNIPLAQHLDIADLSSRLQGFVSQAATYLLFSISDWAGKLFDFIMGFILTIYFILEGDQAYRWFLSFFPREQPRAARHRPCVGRRSAWANGCLARAA